MSEFDIIAKYFRPLSHNQPEAMGLCNDTACLTVPDGYQLIVSTDTLNENIHFFKGAPPEVIAQKALRSNLSDIAASGAKPYCYQLAIAMPQSLAENQSWLSAFTGALLADQREAQIFCSGGDTTSIKGGLSITITIFGLAPKGRVVKRSGASDGDSLIVTGHIGAGGLAYRNGKTIAPPMRSATHEAISNFAKAALDISDGLLADVGHIVNASKVGVDIVEHSIPIVGALDRSYALTAGDDYEIALAVAPEDEQACLAALKQLSLRPAVIGRFTSNHKDVILRGRDGAALEQAHKTGWQHF